MSKTALAIALLLLIALAGAGMILLSAPATPSAPQTVQLLPTIVPERVARLELIAPARGGAAASTEVFVRDNERWRDGETGWPVRTDAVRNAIRAISGLEGEAYGEEPAEGLRELRVTMDDGTEHTLRYDDRAFAGATYGVTDAGVAEFPSFVLDSLAISGIEIFEEGLFPALRTDRVGRFEIADGQHTLRARRLEGRWLVDLGEDAWARARNESIDAALDRFRLQRTTSVRPGAPETVTDPPPELPPDLRVSLEYRNNEGRFRARINASIASPGAIVSIPGVESAFVSLADDALLDLVIDPIAYAADTALDLVTTDVRTIGVMKPNSARALTRTLDGWDDGDGATSTNTREADELLALLTRTQGRPLRAADAPFEPLVTIDLSDDTGLLHTVEAGYNDDARFVVRVGPVVWAYPRASPPAILRLAPPR